MLSDYQAEGVVFAGSGYLDDPRGPELAAAVERARERGIRVVALAMRDFDAPRIVADNRAAAFDVTDYVLSLGHRRIAFIGGPAALYASRDRERGLSATPWRRPARRAASSRATSPMSAATPPRSR